ncbi:TIGR03862 family flavoprotein [Rhodomicrobium sp. Az07]|uniref:TIGR03862 family flavoprotein n=1 Tax=Rhodomicrobium sp. Az07 TaxID=2839034 RepID=UPI001BEB29D8|nr:TIGR03862 family flavoprotein [Rhodomicrobium sp. Az07]MBT3069624.1 TIGR03862 family flavoprotein [Rhodomicrobium sp. Az07]
MADTGKTVAIVGGGPAGLMAAEVLAGAGVAVTVYDAMPSVGRKFLLAGRGGLNLTHSEELPQFLARYGAAEPHLRGAVEAFRPSALVAWCEGLGQETFIGTSGRVFPKAMKASPMLRAWLVRLRGLGVAFRQRHRWRGWDEAGALVFDTPDGPASVRADATILALGGASWPRLGSDGGWVPILAREGIDVAPLKPSNCGFLADLSDIFLARFEGEPLKGAAFSFDGRSVRGDATITKAGIEGGAIYGLSATLREAIERDGAADLVIDLRPGIEGEALEAALSRPRGKQTQSTHLRKAAKLAPVAIGLLHEEAIRHGSPLSDLDAAALVRLIKDVRVPLIAPAPIARAISSAGGVPFAELDGFMLHKKPGVFIAGEMLDYEAPTGGYLLQAAFSTGAAAARGALAFITRH